MGNRLTGPIYWEPVTEKDINTLINALKIQQLGLMAWIPCVLNYLLKFWLSHWPTSAVRLLPKEFSRVNWKVQMSPPCIIVMILCCLIITDLFLYCVFYQRLGFFIKRIFSYWQHILAWDGKNNIVNEAIHASVLMDLNDKISYYSRVKALLSCLDVWRPEKLY